MHGRKLILNPLRTGGGECFPPGLRFPANTFGSNKGTHTLSDFF